MAATKIILSILMVIFGTVLAGTTSKTNTLNYLDSTNWPKERASKNSGFQFWGGVGVAGAGLIFLSCTLHELNEVNNSDELKVPETPTQHSEGNLIPFPTQKVEEPPLGQPLSEDDFDSLVDAKLNQKNRS
ncbi:hypothetical protein [Argonema antarcticum]|uniref:hypothetical protein n=1 Tax=Argonema antarcticum TaxID=2942763 RepID=UPI002012686A|nr:hypothetical protein [Argonema antarcticum]MCL1474457.1 hypothetical protein [Argonema antarcticum A004/B2]